MKNKIWLLALALFVVHSSKVLGDGVHSRTVATAQQTKGKVVTGVISDDMGPIVGATISVKGTQNGLIWMETLS